MEVAGGIVLVCCAGVLLSVLSGTQDMLKVRKQEKTPWLVTLFNGVMHSMVINRKCEVEDRSSSSIPLG